MIVKQTNNYLYYSVVNFDCEYILEILDNACKYNDKFIFVISTKHIFPHNQCEKKTISTIKHFYKLSKDSNKKFILIFEEIQEAPSYRYDLKTYIDSIVTKCNLPLSNIIIWSGAVTQLGDIDFIASYSLFNCVFLQKSNLHNIPTHHFISLARIARTNRVLATVEILERQLDKFGYMSCGSGYYESESENDFNIVPDKWKQLMPLILDQRLTGLRPKGEWDGSDTRISGAFLNLVYETSYDYGINQGGWNTWYLTFLTEKTIKPFVWGQVPLILSTQNTLPYIKEFGFDLFDDIIDHSYDNEPDGYKRIKLVIDQLEKICQKPIQYWQDYKKENIKRFQKNNSIAFSMESKNLLIENFREKIKNA